MPQSRLDRLLAAAQQCTGLHTPGNWELVGKRHLDRECECAWEHESNITPEGWKKDGPWIPMQAAPITKRRADLPDDKGDGYEYFINHLYQVAVGRFEPKNEGEWPVVHLSIKRRDRRPIHNWRHFQQIKNELVGDSCEAVEIYPADSRLVDTSNQYHLWVIADPQFRMPFGFQVRMVWEGNFKGAVQEPFEQGMKPAGCLDVGNPEDHDKLIEYMNGDEPGRTEIAVPRTTEEKNQDNS